MLQILLFVFIGVVFFQLLFYFGIFSRFAFSKQQETAPKNIPVSVVICAKNEAENLRNNLPKILEQDYNNFEVVLINDASYDDTLEIMEAFEKKYPNIKIVDVENNEAFWGNKKYALTLGIKAAKHNFLLFTDADCVPETNQWIKEMTSNFSNEKTIVLGYGAYEKVKGSFTNFMVRFETFITALHYFSFAKSGMPYMGVGRNLAYHRSEFFEASGFMNHMNILSGDDDLFINQVANSKNTSVCFHKDSFTLSEAPKKFSNWFRQKRRHISTAKHYKFKHKFLLAIHYVLQILFWSLATILLSFLHEWIIVASIVGFRFLCQYIVYGGAAKRLKSSKLIILLPFQELFLILFQFGIFIANSISKPNHWK